MYISQKLITGIFITVLVLVGGYYAFTKMIGPAENVNLNPSPDNSLFGGKTPTTSGLSFDNKQSGQQNSNQLSLSTPANAPANQVTNKPRTYTKAPDLYPLNQLQNKKAVIVTNKGTIEFEILPEAPMAASNFIFLAQDHFYDGLIFHRAVPGFVIQGGDPLGNGTGGPGYKFNDEPVKRNYDKGIVAMANSGPNTNGSQFFIMLADNSLPPQYTIFGKVIKGQDVVDKIQVGDVMQQVAIQSL